MFRFLFCFLDWDTWVRLWLRVRCLAWCPGGRWIFVLLACIGEHWEEVVNSETFKPQISIIALIDL